MSTEREKFEAWAEPITALGKDAKGQYVEVMTSLAFEAWEARAALGEQSTPAPQVDMRPYETWIAIREGHLNAAAEEYFSARPQLDSAANRRIFYAGHCKGYEVAAPQVAPKLVEECVSVSLEPCKFSGICKLCAPEPQGVPSRSQKLRDAGYTRRPTAKALPPEDEPQGVPDGWRQVVEGAIEALEWHASGHCEDSMPDATVEALRKLRAMIATHPQQSAPEPQGVPEWVLVPREIVDRFPEINPSNYDHDDACELNAWGVELVLAAHPQPPAQPQQVRQIPVGKKYVPGVSQEVHDRFNAVLLGESPLSKVDPVQAAADEFNNTFHKCRAEVSSDWWQRIWQKALAWKADHPQQERKPLSELDIEAAAKVLADAMDYPWTFMPHQERENMKETARSICNAAHPQQSAPAEPVELPWATTAEDAASELAKWLNERPNRPICLEHVAVVVHSVQSAAAPVAPEPDEDEAAAWMYPCDVEKFKRGEHVGEAFSIKVGSPTHGVSVPLFTKDQLIAYAAACVAARAPTQEK